MKRKTTHEKLTIKRKVMKMLGTYIFGALIVDQSDGYEPKTEIMNLKIIVLSWSQDEET